MRVVPRVVRLPAILFGDDLVDPGLLTLKVRLVVIGHVMLQRKSRPEAADEGG
jgi:hypothetical protein